MSSFANSQSDSATSVNATEHYFRFNYDNDFFSATDRYYTQGIQLSFIHPMVRYSPFAHTLIKLKNSKNYFGFHGQQECYTPRSIRVDTIYFGERPFTGTFYISHSLTSLNNFKKILLQTQLDLGIIGSCALCENEQKAIHRALVNIQPLGWEYQLKNDVIVNYRVKFEKGIVSKPNIEMMLGTAARLGTLFTDVGIGVNARFGWFDSYFTNLGLARNKDSRLFKMYLVTKANAKLVGYNATLQGGLFTSSIYQLSANEISRVVFDAEAAIVVAYKRMSLEYARTYITPEFYKGVDHGWGRCVITVCF
jgi:lipid A 3-O-deacylase